MARLIDGPQEPPEFKWLRRQYWEKRAWINRLEERICRTESGLAFVMRVKAVGYAR